MAKWVLTISQLTGNGQEAYSDVIQEKILSGKLVKTLGDTAKLTFSIAARNLPVGSDYAPFCAYVTLDRYNGAFYRMFTGLVEKRTYSVIDGIYTFECCGGLGAHKYFAPFRLFGPGSNIDDVVRIIGERYRNTASSPYNTYNPTADIYKNIYDLRYLGDTRCTLGVWLNERLAEISSSAATSYDFLKEIINIECFEEYDATWTEPFLFEDPDGLIIAKMRSTTPQAQAIRYDKNLISCEITDEPTVTIADVKNKSQRQVVVASNYPDPPFYYQDYILPDKSGSGTYTNTELQTYGNIQLQNPPRTISAVGFDRGILDDGTPFLTLDAPVNLVYLEGYTEKTIETYITSITYNLTNPAQDRVQLGRKIIPLTQRS